MVHQISNKLYVVRLAVWRRGKLCIVAPRIMRSEVFGFVADHRVFLRDARGAGIKERASLKVRRGVGLQGCLG